MVFESRETAAFNLALPYLTRINSILNSNYTEFKNGNMRAFAVNLKQLYRELKPWLIIDKKTGKDERKELEDAFDELAKIDSKSKNKIWNKMEEIEDIMRAHFKALGMLMPKIHDPRFLFGKIQH